MKWLILGLLITVILYVSGAYSSFDKWAEGKFETQSAQIETVYPAEMPTVDTLPAHSPILGWVGAGVSIALVVSVVAFMFYYAVKHELRRAEDNNNPRP